MQTATPHGDGRQLLVRLQDKVNCFVSVDSIVSPCSDRESKWAAWLSSTDTPDHLPTTCRPVTLVFAFDHVLELRTLWRVTAGSGHLLTVNLSPEDCICMHLVGTPPGAPERKMVRKASKEGPTRPLETKLGGK